MSILVAKNSPEFRRPATVQRNNKNGLAKYHLGANSGSRTTDWEVRTLAQGINGLQSRLKHHHEKKFMTSTSTATSIVTIAVTTTTTSSDCRGLPSLPISRDVLSTLPSCKISNLRLTSEASPSESPHLILKTSTDLLTGQTNQHEDNSLLPQPMHMNKNNNLTNSNCNKDTDLLLRLSLTSTASSSIKDDDDEEESSRDSAESKNSSLASLLPILSAPATIRFPAKMPSKNRGPTTDSGFCRWDKCEINYDTSSALLEHLQIAHINTQTGGDNFVCQWQGCKVQGRTSCSRRWLERHVLSHGGNKPFQCIVDGCGNRFSSQTALERHVNGHFNQSETSSTTSRKSTDVSGKLVRRNGKKLRYRRQPWSARIFDYFDSGVMEGLQHRLLELAKMRTRGKLAETPGDSMTLTSQVLAKRVEMDGKIRVLLRWYPQDIEPDEWVLENDKMNIKHVTIRSVATKLPDEVNIALYPAVNGIRHSLQRVKHHRKSKKNT
ncbi:PREDICTED: zinc finger protein jing [Ceratosolen solmsi marchali]|uniref:Zinc finger protein jing n=1 Tax=Ceratosolen solmsi marchali TaxID=326594 RepID=A0AAJ6YSR4_9HYME|nr:PREDICTED: zinc finger protein jing [Ceratosolen solmsi marchali]